MRVFFIQEVHRSNRRERNLIEQRVEEPIELANSSKSLSSVEEKDEIAEKIRQIKVKYENKIPNQMIIPETNSLSEVDMIPKRGSPSRRRLSIDSNGNGELN